MNWALLRLEIKGKEINEERDDLKRREVIDLQQYPIHLQAMQVRTVLRSEVKCVNVYSARLFRLDRPLHSLMCLYKQAIGEFNRLRQEALMARRDLTIHREA